MRGQVSVVSVLMPLYNASATVESAIESLTRQTFSEVEIVAVDDGSTDGTGTIIERLAGLDDRIRLISAGHEGLVAALNLGLSTCRGELVARMDGDDVCHPERLRLQCEFLALHPEISVCSSRVRSFPQREVLGGFQRYEEWLNSLCSHEDIARDLFVESPIAHPSAMLRTAELRELGGYREFSGPEDYDLWLRYFTAGKRFGKVPRTLLFWRAHESRLTFTDSRYSLENFIRLKAHYLARMLSGREVIIWGAGMTGRRLSKHLVREGAEIRCFVDVDPKKIGRELRGIPIISPESLSEHKGGFVLASVGSAKARQLIREYLCASGRTETRDFLCVA